MVVVVESGMMGGGVGGMCERGHVLVREYGSNTVAAIVASSTGVARKAK